MSADISQMEKQMAQKLGNGSFADTRRRIDFFEEHARGLWAEKQQMEKDAFDRLSQGIQAAGATGVRLFWGHDLFSFFSMTYEELASGCPEVQLHAAADQEGYLYLNGLRFGPMQQEPSAWNAISALTRYREGKAESFRYGKWEKIPLSIRPEEGRDQASAVSQILLMGMPLSQSREILSEESKEFLGELPEKRKDMEKVLLELATVLCEQEDIRGYSFGIHPDTAIYFTSPFYQIPAKKALCTLIEARTPDERNGLGGAIECTQFGVDEESIATARNLHIFRKMGTSFTILKTTAPIALDTKKDFSWV